MINYFEIEFEVEKSLVIEVFSDFKHRKPHAIVLQQREEKREREREKKKKRKRKRKNKQTNKNGFDLLIIAKVRIISIFTLSCNVAATFQFV